MAEIKIEKKTPIWPWIIVILVVLAIVAYFIYNNDPDNTTIYDNDIEETDTISSTFDEGYGTTTPYMSNDIVQEFENSVSDSSRIAVDSIYTKTAIVNLAKVVTMKADELNIQSSLALENLKFYTEQEAVSTDTDETGKDDIYNNIQKVSKDIVAVLENIQTENYPTLEDEVSELKQTTDKIKTNIATKEQQNTLQTFFIKAKEVVNNMNT